MSEIGMEGPANVLLNEKTQLPQEMNQHNKGLQSGLQESGEFLNIGGGSHTDVSGGLMNLQQPSNYLGKTTYKPRELVRSFGELQVTKKHHIQAHGPIPKAKYRKIAPKPNFGQIFSYQWMSATPVHRVVNLSYIMGKAEFGMYEHRQLQYGNDRRLRQELQAGIIGAPYGGQGSFFGQVEAEFLENIGESCNAGWVDNTKDYSSNKKVAKEGRGIRIEALDNDEASSGSSKVGEASKRDGPSGAVDGEGTDVGARGGGKGN